MIVSLIIAMTEANLIGTTAKDSKGIPWNCPEDMIHFVKTTVNKAILVGATTFEAIGKPLPSRLNLVLSSRAAELNKTAVKGVIYVGSIKEAIDVAQSNGYNELCICGGGKTYTEAYPYVDRIYFTRILPSTLPQGDVFFDHPVISILTYEAYDHHLFKGWGLESQRATPSAFFYVFNRIRKE